MKVEGTSLPPIAEVKEVNKVRSGEQQLISHEDGFAVSEKAELYKVLQTKIKAMPAVREERVREVAEQIKSGEFKVDARKIAENILCKQE